MAYSKKATYRRKTGYKRPTYRKKNAAYSLGRIKRVINLVAEKKFIQYDTGVLNYPATPTDIFSFLANTAFAGISQGQDVANRIGNKIHISSITIRVHSVGTAGIPVNGAMFRWGVYTQRHAEGALPSPTAIWTANTLRAQRDLVNLPKIGVTLSNEVMGSVVVTGTNAGAVVASGPPRCWTVKLYPNKVFTYTGTTGVMANIASNDIGWHALADAGGLSYSMNVQIRFTDV